MDFIEKYRESIQKLLEEYRVPRRIHGEVEIQWEIGPARYHRCLHSLEN